MAHGLASAYGNVIVIVVLMAIVMVTIRIVVNRRD